MTYIEPKRQVEEKELIIVYETIIPKWQREQDDDILHFGKKDYSKADSLEDLIRLASNTDLQVVPYKCKELWVMLYSRLLEETIKQCLPVSPTDFVTPEILASDSIRRLKLGQSYEDCILFHKDAVQIARILMFYYKALSDHLSKEVYGRNIIDLDFEDSPTAFMSLKNMLVRDCAISEDRDLSYTKSHAEGQEQLEDIIYWSNKNNAKNFATETIVKKISKSKRDAPALHFYLPAHLPNFQRSVLQRLYQNQNTEDAKLLSDAVTGKFRALRHEFVCDYKNEIERRSTEKWRKDLKADSLDIPVDSSDFDIEDETTIGDQILGLSKQINQDPQSERFYDLWKNLRFYKITENHVELSDTIGKLEKELEKPKYDKLRSLYYELKANPEAYDTDLAKKLKIKRNAVPKRKKELKKLAIKFDLI